MRDELNKLAERVEALTGPDREVDVLVFQAIGAPAPFQFANKLIALEYNDIEQAYFARVSDDMRVRYSPPTYTASLDAAMVLVPDSCRSGVLHYALRSIQETGFPDCTFLQKLICNIVGQALRARAELTA